ncbi:MAG: ABC transporter permease, partial [Bryobacteraceae bacterium]|nr:ABC transporter permease [Bryobacteraceae bacterium]
MSGYTPADKEDVTLQENSVSPGYFRTTGMPLIAGRDFNDRDDLDHPNVVIVNEALARRYFREGQAVGQSLGYGTANVHIVGVVANARVNTLREEPSPMAWYPVAQWTFLNGPGIEVRLGSTATTAESLRRVIGELDASVTVAGVFAYPAQINKTLSREILLAGLSGTFGTVALLLAALGLYGVMSYSVARRTAEFGIRLALGASRRVLLWQTLRQAL